MFCSSAIDWSVTAAWAQAFLSALAIFAAVWLQDRDRRLRAEERQKSRREAILAIGRNISLTLGWLDRRARAGELVGRFGYYEDELNADLMAVASMDLSSLEDASLATALMRLRTLVTTARRRLEQDRSKAGKGEQVPADRFSSLLKKARKTVSFIAGETASMAVEADS